MGPDRRAGSFESSSRNPFGEPGLRDLHIGLDGPSQGRDGEHGGICNRLWWMQQTYRLDATDRVLQKTPYSFDVSVWEFFWPLISGASLVVAKPGGHQDSGYLVDLIRQRAVTTVHFVPSMLQVFVEEEDLPECESLRRVICSGEALPYDLQERLFSRLGEVELHNLYGPTEASVDVTAWACRRGDPRRMVPIGRPSPICSVTCWTVVWSPCR